MPDIQAQFGNLAVGNVCQDERLGYVATCLSGKGTDELSAVER
jgi:hypothetical protein